MVRDFPRMRESSASKGLFAAHVGEPIRYNLAEITVRGCVEGGLVEGRGVMSPELRHVVFLGILCVLTAFSAFGDETVPPLSRRGGGSHPSLDRHEIIWPFASCLQMTTS